jgi:ectoine hydroxylase-related dioxygenase (phytanoyl-CoA dioxygenase family)
MQFAATTHGLSNVFLTHRTVQSLALADGNPLLLTVWIPVSHVTVDNGCMYVVPREFDAGFSRDEAPEHMLVQHTGKH